MQRRDFLIKSGLLTVSALSANSLYSLANAPEKVINPFGVQLFSVRDILPQDPKGVMEKLAKMGYKQFESFAGPDGFLWGMQPKEMKSFLDDLGVKMVSTHFDFRKAITTLDALKQ